MYRRVWVIETRDGMNLSWVFVRWQLWLANGQWKRAPVKLRSFGRHVQEVHSQKSSNLETDRSFLYPSIGRFRQTFTHGFTGKPEVPLQSLMEKGVRVVVLHTGVSTIDNRHTPTQEVHLWTPNFPHVFIPHICCTVCLA